MSATLLTVRVGGSELSLPAGRAYLIGRDPECDIVIPDDRVSWRHAVLRVEDGRWVLADNGSTNGIFAGDRQVHRFELEGECLVRLGHPADGPLLSCATTTGARVLRIGRARDNDLVIPDPGVSAHHAELRSVPGGQEPGGLQIVDLDSFNGTFLNEERVTAAPLREGDIVGFGAATFRLAGRELQALGSPQAPGSPQAQPADPAPRTLEIPYAVRWLVPRGERFVNFDILNDNDTQLDYYRRFGHIYAVGVPGKKWRLVVVSDPGLLDEVAADEEQFGKRVEEINFFTQLAHTRGGGLSVIGDGEHYNQVRRVMLPWYAPQNQRTQLEQMKERARKLVAAWAAFPEGAPFDARAWMERYTLEVSAQGACARDFGMLDGNPHPFAVAVQASTKESIKRVAEPYPDRTVFARRARRERVRAYRGHNKELFRTAAAIAATAPAGQQTDLLTRLLSTPDPQTGQLLDARTVRDQILMHMSNGFNGPSITAAWLAYILATRPDVEAGVLAEIDQITGGDLGYDLQYDDLMALPYTTAVIKETMRIYPPMPVTIRRSLKDGMLGSYRVRRGDIILVGTLAAQRDPRYWGPDPGAFDPGQFAVERIAARPRHAFIPFSIGQRQCMAQEVTFMMLRVLLFEICRRYRLRLAPGATVTKDTVVTTKPATVPVVLLPRQRDEHRPAPAAPAQAQAQAQEQAPAPAQDQDQDQAPAQGWGEPTEIPAASLYRHLVIAYGSNFGANKELAERFAERSDFYGYTSEVVTLDALASAPPRTELWLLVVMTSTYTSNPPSNATAFKSWLERTAPGSATWQNCRYLVWGLGNSQWNAFLAFPRYVHGKLTALGATSLAGFDYGDVGSPGWERRHADWNGAVWPALLKLSGARPTRAAAARDAAGKAAAAALTGTDSGTAMRRSLSGDDSAPRQDSRVTSMTSVMLAPAILTNAVGISTVRARVLASQELQAAGSPGRTRHLEIALPAGLTYQVGDHLGVCPENDEEVVERLARHLGAAPDGLFVAPRAMTMHALPKGVALQVRNVLANLVDISGKPAVPFLELLLSKAADAGELSKLAQIREILLTPDGPASPLRAQIDAGAYDVLRLLDEFGSCRLNIFEFLRVAQPLRPRYYSVSSSPLIHGDSVVHVTVALRGLGSHFLHTLREGRRLNVFVDSAARFRMQQDVTKPMIFVSAGTGIAPMRAFLWERLALRRSGARLAEAALFNGIRSSDSDFIYQAEIEGFAAEGVLDHVHVATSRERPGHRDYVQDRLREQAALTWRLLEDGGFVYVCGSLPVREAVHAAVTDVIAEQGRLPHERAVAYLRELETTARYRPDQWG